MKKASSQVFHAVIVTILACSVVFGLAIYFFGSNTLLNNNSTITQPSPLPLTATQAIVIPIPLEDNTGIVFTGSEVVTGSIISTVTSTGNITTPCTREYAPVCGNDNNTYPNACVANSVGIVTLTAGECKKIEKSLTGSTKTGSITEVIPSKNDNTKACTMEYAPICGVDNKTYGNSCMAGEVAIAHIGECDGTEKKLFDTGSYQLYTNAGVGYSFAMPKYSHYAGGGARDGASHTMAIGITSSGVTDFTTAPVQVWFYRKTPANPPSAQSAQ